MKRKQRKLEERLGRDAALTPVKERGKERRKTIDCSTILRKFHKDLSKSSMEGVPHLPGPRLR